MNICIVGGAGFVGYHIANFYAKKGHNVIVLDNLSRSRLCGKKISNISSNVIALTEFSNFMFYNIDIRNYDNLLMFFKSNQIDVVVHCAAQTAVTSSIKDPKVDFETNCLGTFNLLESIRESGQKPTFLYCSTNKVYGSNVGDNKTFRIPCIYGSNANFVDVELNEGMVDENVSIDQSQHSPYGVSKLCGDLYVQEYGRTYGFRTGVFRMSCIYGTHQFGVEDQGWVMHFIKSAIASKPITIFGSGRQIRDILYVSDLVEAFDSFINRYDKSNVFNIGGGDHNKVSLIDLICFLENELKLPTTIKYEEERPADQELYVTDISKVRDLLDWRVKVNWKDGVRSVIEWLKIIKYL